MFPLVTPTALHPIHSAPCQTHLLISSLNHCKYCRNLNNSRWFILNCQTSFLCDWRGTLCVEPGSAASRLHCCWSLLLSSGNTAPAYTPSKPTTAIPHGCFGSIEFSSNVIFLSFGLNGSTGLQFRPVETLHLLSPRFAYFPLKSQL